MNLTGQIRCHTSNFVDTPNSPPIECKGSFDECKVTRICDVGVTSCFLLWWQNGTRFSAGCNLPDTNTTLHDNCNSTCIAHRIVGGRLYCCCNSDTCNYDYNVANSSLASNPSEPTTTPAQTFVTQEEFFNPWWSLIPALLVLFIALGLFVYTKRRRSKNNTLGIRDEEDNYMNRQMMMPMLTRPPYTNQYHHGHHNYYNQHELGAAANNDQETDMNGTKIDLSKVKLGDVLGRGRFGIVYRAHIEGESDDSDKNEPTSKEVAVKVINADEHHSWQNEQFVYKSHKIRHPNILNYLYSDEHVDSDSYWLIVEYAQRGSLFSYLKESPVEWKDFLSMASGIVEGLNHLHDAYIAHRDFKSTNVLLRQDLTPCITDFGVATILDSANGSHINQKYLQVGTPRYMAPEVLECNIHFTKSSFLKIDVYALSLVLWELLSRAILPPITRIGNSTTPHRQQMIHPAAVWHDRQATSSPSHSNGVNTSPSSEPSTQEGSQPAESEEYVPPPFMLPFEDVAGPKPSIERMIQIVVNEKQRPPFRREWTACPRLEDLCRSVLKEGWETDFDARITASCLLERVTSFVDKERALLGQKQ